MYRHFKILVAEDNPHDAFFLKRAFLRAGINAPIQFVDDGEQALNYLGGATPFTNRESFPLPNLMLLDIKMPRLDGFGVLRWVRRQPRLRRLPVVVFTSSGEPRDVDLAHELGANAYTVKPSAPDQLLDVVLSVERYWLRHHRYPSLTSAIHLPPG
jgi:CheY-like chemotaxis protein